MHGKRDASACHSTLTDMRAKTLVAILALAVATVMPSLSAAQAFDSGSRAELYRRHMLAGKDVPCRTNASCAAMAVAALEAGQLKEATNLIDMERVLADAETLQAQEENDPRALSSARARVAMALVHEGDVEAKLGRYVNARANYRTAIDLGDAHPDDVVLVQAAATARRRFADIVGDAAVRDLPVVARFDSYRALGAWNTVTLTPVKGRRGIYRLEGEFLNPGVDRDGRPGAMVGHLAAYVRFYDGAARVPVVPGRDTEPLDATAKLVNLAAYESHPDRCLVEFRLDNAETLEVTTHGAPAACGFGSGVIADGRYYLMTGS